MLKPTVTSHELPENMKNVTLQQLKDSCNDFSYQDNTLKMRKITDEGVISVEYKSYGAGYKTQKVAVINMERKKDYKEMIKEMKKDGMKQQEIASVLNISQAYVSKLLKG